MKVCSVCAYDVCTCKACVCELEMERWPLCHLLRLLQVQGSNSEGDGSPYPSVKVTNYNVNNNSVREHKNYWPWGLECF